MNQKVFVGWRPQHLSVYEETKAKTAEQVLFFGINQKTLAAAKTANVSALPPWDLVDEELLASIDADAAVAVDVWRQTASCIRKEANSSLLSSLALENFDALRFWMWNREISYVRRLLLRLLGRLQRAELLAPNATELHLERWYGPLDLAAYAIRGLIEERKVTVRWVDVKGPLPSSPSPPLPPLSTMNAPGLTAGKWLLFHALGVPDLPYYLEKMLRHGLPIAILIDDELSGDLPALYDFARRRGRLHMIPLFGPPFDVLKNKARESLRDLAMPNADSLYGHLVNDHWPRHVAVWQLLSSMFDTNPPTHVVLSSHASPEGLALVELCAAKNIGGTVIEHSSWPLEKPAFMLPKGKAHWCYFASTRKAALEFYRRSAELKSCAVRIVPPPRFDLHPRRLLRTIATRMLLPSSRKSPLRIGVIVTSGEAIHAPDVPFTQILDCVRSLTDVPHLLQGKVEFLFRLRSGQDYGPILQRYGCSNPTPWVRVEYSQDRPPVLFLRECDLVIEIGLQSTACFEAFAELVPYLRIGLPATRRRDGALPDVVPILAQGHVWEGLKGLVNSQLHRRRLTLRQFVYYVNQTREGAIKRKRAQAKHLVGSG